MEHQIEADNAFYFTTLSLLVMNYQRWRGSRLTFLGRLLVAAHCRAKQSASKGESKEKQVLDYSVYKPALVFFALVNGIYDIILKVKCWVIRCRALVLIVMFVFFIECTD